MIENKLKHRHKQNTYNIKMCQLKKFKIAFLNNQSQINTILLPCSCNDIMLTLLTVSSITTVFSLCKGGGEVGQTDIQHTIIHITSPLFLIRRLNRYSIKKATILRLLNSCNLIQLHKQIFLFYFCLLNFTVGEACVRLRLAMGISLHATLELPIETENVPKKLF